MVAVGTTQGQGERGQSEQRNGLQDGRQGQVFEQLQGGGLLRALAVNCAAALHGAATNTVHTVLGIPGKLLQGGAEAVGGMQRHVGALDGFLNGFRGNGHSYIGKPPAGSSQANENGARDQGADNSPQDQSPSNEADETNQDSQRSGLASKEKKRGDEDEMQRQQKQREEQEQAQQYKAGESLVLDN